MKFVLIFLGCCLIVFVPKEALAQTEGCLLPSSNRILYTQRVTGLTTILSALLGGSPLYSANTTVQTAASNCFYYSNSNYSTCKVCPGGLTYGILGPTGCNGSFVTGVVSNYQVQCALDGLEMLLLGPVGLFGFFRLRKFLRNR